MDQMTLTLQGVPYIDPTEAPFFGKKKNGLRYMKPSTK